MKKLILETVLELINKKITQSQILIAEIRNLAMRKCTKMNKIDKKQRNAQNSY